MLNRLLSAPTQMSPYLKVEAPGGGQAIESEVAADIRDEGTVKWAGPVELSGDSGSPIKVLLSCCISSTLCRCRRTELYQLSWRAAEEQSLSAQACTAPL